MGDRGLDAGIAHRATDEHLAGRLAATTGSLGDCSLGLNLLVVDDVFPLLHGRAAISEVAYQAPFTQHVTVPHDECDCSRIPQR